MQNKRFQKNDSGFVCTVCQKTVKPLGYTSRDHCPHCLSSIHIDIMPGDRANNCLGILRPIQALPDAKKGFIILYKCEKCGEIVRNKFATDDNMSLLIKLTNPENGQ